jgi:hypothetical protein
LALEYDVWYVSNDKYLTAKIQEDEVMQDFLEYKEEHGLDSKSATVRKLLRVGLEAERESAEKTYTSLEETFLTVASVIAGVVLFLPLLPFLGLASAASVSVAGVVYLALAAVIVVGVDFRARRREAPSTAATGGRPGVSN